MDRVRRFLGADDERSVGLRMLGGLLLGVGMLLVFIRRGAGGDVFADTWGDFALLLVLLAPCVFLYGGGMLAARATGGGPTWQAVYLIFGTLLVPLVLFQFVEWIGGDTGSSWNVAWIFLLSAVAGGAAAFRGEVRYGLLLAALAIIIAWLALWNELLTDGIGADVGTLRGLLVAIGVALLAGGVGLRLFGGEDGPERSDELLIGGAVAAVGAGAISFAAVYTQAPPFAVPIGEPSAFWDGYLLVVSVAMVVLAAGLGVRGLAYVGGIGLWIFALVVGLDLDDSSPAGKVVGWPLIVLILGAAAFIASLAPGLRATRARQTSGAAESPGDGQT